MAFVTLKPQPGLVLSFFFLIFGKSYLNWTSVKSVRRLRTETKLIDETLIFEHCKLKVVLGKILNSKSFCLC